MKKKMIGIFVFMMFFSISVFPVTSNQLSELKNIKTFDQDTEPEAFSIVRIDISGKGEVKRYDDVNYVLFNLTESNIKGFAFFKYELIGGNIKSRWFFSSFEITGPAAGFFSLFIGNIEYNSETEIFAARGFAIFFAAFNTVTNPF